MTLHLHTGQSLALLGANGSGKTTLLKIIAGAIAPTNGTIAFAGHELQRDVHARRSRVGLLSSATYLYDDLTALENIRFALTMAGRHAIDEKILEVLERVRLRDHAADRVRTFSSGMKRRLSIARVQILEPDVVLLDEPYNSLDAQGADTVDDWVAQITGRGGAVVVATHDAERALRYATSVGVLRRGDLTFFGTSSEYRSLPPLHVG